MDNTRKIIIIDTTKKIADPEKLREKKTRRAVSDWKFTEEDYSHENQICIIDALFSKNGQENTGESHKTAIQQLQKKISGYKSQDMLKKLYDPDKFVTIDNVITHLRESKLICFYCKTPVQVLYSIVRELHQWTLDRVDNLFGHNNDNVMIACLDCNLKRKTMYHERYAFTKTFTTVKKLDS
jgi:5-methylcytosine-specific restriction endonuclease McrA